MPVDREVHVGWLVGVYVASSLSSGVLPVEQEVYTFAVVNRARVIAGIKYLVSCEQAGSQWMCNMHVVGGLNSRARVRTLMVVQGEIKSGSWRTAASATLEVELTCCIEVPTLPAVQVFCRLCWQVQTNVIPLQQLTRPPCRVWLF